MISLNVKRLFSQIPWIFTEPHLPPYFKQQTDICSTSMLNKLGPGFLYAFDSLLDSFAEADISHLRPCLEPSFYDHISSGFSYMKEKDLKFHRINKDKPEIMLLSYSFHLGLDIVKSNNPEGFEKTRYRPCDVFPDIFKNLKNRYPDHSLNLHLDILKDKLYYYKGAPPLGVIVRFEIGFTGNKFLSLDGGGGNKECHVVTFESEIEEFRNFGMAKFLYLKKDIYEKFGDDYFDSCEWIISDIDNQITEPLNS